jgi:diguanylate cyclase (GGDEF)-like protein
MKQFWLNLPLGTKIASLTSFLVMASILVLTLIFIQWEREYFHQGLENQASLLLNTLPLTMRDQLYHMELDELIDIAKVVSQDKDIQQFVIFDNKGLILYDSSRPEMVFSQIVDPLGRILINYEADQIYTDWQENLFIAGKSIRLGNQTLGAVAVGLSTAVLDTKISSLTQQSLIFVLITLIIGIGLSFWLGRQIVSPLRELADVACQMATGDIFIQIDIASRDEVGQLGDAFNQMTASVQKREFELRELAAGLEQTIEERTIELRRHNKQLERIAIEDPLTGIYNRRHFFELASKEVERAKRYGNPLSVMIMDADHFKKMNDTFGHMIGDQILISLAELCLKNIRGQDIIARYGGEEFVVLMPEANHEDACKTAERLRKLVAETSMVPGAIDVMITISLGVASWESGDQELDFDAMLARADQALYYSKESGRNRVSSWQELQAG